MRKNSSRKGQHQPKGQWIRTHKRFAIYLRDGYTCLYCGTHMAGFDAAEVTLDHIIPKSAGGSNEATNLVTCCRSCNSSRKDTAWLEFATGGAVKRIRLAVLRAIPLHYAKAFLLGASDEELEFAIARDRSKGCKF